MKILSVLFLALFNQVLNEPQLCTIEGRAQGTTYTIKYVPKGGEIAKSSIDSIFRVIDHSLSLYDPASLINRFNNSGRVLMDEHMKRVINASLKVYSESGGAFDITSASISKAWGFNPGGKKEVPGRREIRKVLKLTGSQYLSVKGDSLIAMKRGVKIDCNGIAQGYSVDVIAAFLSEQGIDQMLVELGGEIVVKGEHPDTGSWKIGIESVEAVAGEWHPVQTIIPVKNKAITTSGNYRNYFAKGAKTYSHVIDPSTGRPVENGIIAVTVITDAAIDADAWDNALFVMGVEKAQEYLEKHNELKAYIIYKDKTGKIQQYKSL